LKFISGTEKLLSTKTNNAHSVKANESDVRIWYC